MENRWGTSRTEAFSDGVFAIAVTLLVLDINIPASEFDDLWHAIVREWPAYLGYATSFLTVGGMWLAHHGMFRRLRYVDARVMRLNLLLLMFVSFLPFPTRLAAEAVRNTDSERVAIIFYGLTLFVITAIAGAMWTQVVRHRELLHDEVSDAEVAEITRRAAPSIGFYAGATLIAIPAPRVAAIMYLVIGVQGVLLARGDTTGPGEPEPT